MEPPFSVLYEDDCLLAIDKPAGIASVPAPSIPEAKTVQGKIRAWAMALKGYKPYLLNRLDIQTSGVLLLGKFPRDRVKLENIFKNSGTEKIYLALVKGIPKKAEGFIDIPLEARTANIKVPAKTHYKILKRMADCALLEVKIETGRKHQIRKHLALIGHPLVIDKQYGDFHFNRIFQKRHGMKKMFLHAWKLIFIHPFTSKNITIETPAPRIDAFLCLRAPNRLHL